MKYLDVFEKFDANVKFKQDKFYTYDELKKEYNLKDYLILYSSKGKNDVFEVLKNLKDIKDHATFQTLMVDHLYNYENDVLEKTEPTGSLTTGLTIYIIHKLINNKMLYMSDSLQECIDHLEKLSKFKKYSLR